MCGVGCQDQLGNVGGFLVPGWDREMVPLALRRCGVCESGGCWLCKRGLRSGVQTIESWLGACFGFFTFYRLCAAYALCS